VTRESEKNEFLEPTFSDFFVFRQFFLVFFRHDVVELDGQFTPTLIVQVNGVLLCFTSQAT
jgi:hypothetical protein